MIDRFIDSLPSYANDIVVICIEATPVSNLPRYDSKYSDDRGEPRYIMNCSFDHNGRPVRQLEELRPESQQDRDEEAARKASARKLSSHYQALGFQKWFLPELATKDSDQFLLLFSNEARVDISALLPHFFGGRVPILKKTNLSLVSSDPSRKTLAGPLPESFLDRWERNEFAGMRGSEAYNELVKRAKGYRFRQGKRMPAPFVRLCYKPQKVYIVADGQPDVSDSDACDA